MTGQPRIRVSAVLRWRDGFLLCRHEKPGREYWLLPGGGVHAGESLLEGAAPGAPGGARHQRRAAARGAGGARRLDRAGEQRALAKHVVHIIFAADLTGRSLEAVTSEDAAVRGHRLFTFDELHEVVLHPPIQRFLERWQPGDPVAYLGALWAP